MSELRRQAATPEEARLRALVRSAHSAHEPDAVPAFSALLRRAGRPSRAARFGMPRLAWSAALLLGLLSSAWLARVELQRRTLADDLALARSVSYRAAWSSPTDRLRAPSDPLPLGEGPALPTVEYPLSPKEYL
jgi:hypothetical protein